ncbi:MAG TPA: hypothetical protein VJO33_13775 [Gemmatimonadaceae bacterium]|nr:hypothetical protein [Gemmatimonadaceae bacterium]
MSPDQHLARACINVLLRGLALGGAAWMVAAVASCSGEPVTQPYLADGEVATAGTDFSIALGKPTPIDFNTYDNSRQVVHPSAVAFSSPWHGQRVWLALTPYPNSDSRVENPSLFGSESGDNWAVPTGVTNPLVRTGRGYLSDPELTYDPANDELRLYYREVVQTQRRHRRPRHEADVVYLTRSKDGTTWSPTMAVVTDIGHYVVSPTVARSADGEWRMWSVDAGNAGCTARNTRITLRRSTDGIGWSLPVAVSLSQPGFVPWHLDAQYVPQLNEYWALIAAYPRGWSCTASSLFLATSSDGMNWTTYPSPVLARGALSQFSANVYRSTFAFEPDGNTLTMWLTGATTVRRGDHRTPPVLRWSAAVWHTQRDALLDHVGTQRRVAAPEAEPSFLRRLAADNLLP